MNREKYPSKEKQVVYQTYSEEEREVERVPAVPGMFPNIPVFDRLPSHIRSFKDLVSRATAVQVG